MPKIRNPIKVAKEVAQQAQNALATVMEPTALATTTEWMALSPQELSLQVSRVLKGGVSEKHQALLTELFEKLPEDKLNPVVEQMGALLLQHLFDRVDGEDRERLLQSFALGRSTELTVSNRSLLVSALQKSNLNTTAQQAVVSLFLSTRGADLTRLKNQIDDGSDPSDLQKLVFQQLSAPNRETLLHHIAQETRRIDANKIYSDIDDTLYSSLKDKRVPRGSIYPGVKAFYQALDRGPSVPPDAEGDLSFISARHDLLESQTHKKLKKFGIAATVLTSDELLGLNFAGPMRRNKIENFQQQATLFPEYKFVWIGDNGQTDAQVAVATQTDEQLKLRMNGAFIHEVVPMDETQKARFESQGVNFFHTYIGAAAAAYMKGLISKEGLQDVIKVSSEDLAQVPFKTPEQRTSFERLMLEDREQALRVLASA